MTQLFKKSLCVFFVFIVVYNISISLLIIYRSGKVDDIFFPYSVSPFTNEFYFTEKKYVLRIDGVVVDFDEKSIVESNVVFFIARSYYNFFTRFYIYDASMFNDFSKIICRQIKDQIHLNHEKVELDLINISDYRKNRFVKCD
jgi:hypothetical protein